MDKLRDQYGEEISLRIANGLATTRHVTLRVNTLRACVPSVCGQLDAAGILWCGVPWSGEALILREAREEAVRALPLYARGEVYLQNLSSMLPPILLRALPGENVLDMAAAPGGKTTQIAALTGGKAMITACERSRPRAERLRFNIERQGATRVTVLNMDARQLDELFSFDRILLDAPCTGSGTANLESPIDLSYLPRTVKTQRELLQKALRLLKPGHEMIYSTCSLLAEENEQIVMRAVERGEAEIVPLDETQLEGVPLLPTRVDGTLCICPDECYEGFFVAKLRRISR